MYKYDVSYNSEEDCYECECMTEIGLLKTQGPTRKQAKENMKENISKITI